MQLSIRLNDDIGKRLEKLAHETRRSKTEYVREALEKHLGNLEDLYLSLARIEKPGRRWSLDELEQEHDLDG